MPSMDIRREVLQSLRGKEAVLPNLFHVFEGWPAEVENPYHQALAKGCDAKLEGIFGATAKCDALKGSAFPLFAATWWPNASYNELRVLLCLAIWLFTWDDEIDEPDGSCSDDLDAAQLYRERTIRFVRQCLGFGIIDKSGFGKGDASAPTSKIVASFADVGIPIADTFTLEQRKRFLDEMTRFLEQSRAEQLVRLSGRVPTVEEYWEFRMGTSAVGIAVATLEYANQVRVCSSVMQDSRIKAIYDETIIIISIVNDLLSLKKEIGKGCIDSIVPIYCAQGMNIQDAVNEAVKDLQASKVRFDDATTSLAADAAWEPLRYKHVAGWIEGCKHFCIGNLTWSLATNRYGMASVKSESDGTIHLVL